MKQYNNPAWFETVVNQVMLEQALSLIVVARNVFK